jgi:simple sugar transport system ATP-binding protein
VLLVSSELDEVMALADQIAVMCRGRIVGVVPQGTSREQIGLMMAGVEQPATAWATRGPEEQDDGTDGAKPDGQWQWQGQGPGQGQG